MLRNLNFITKEVELTEAFQADKCLGQNCYLDRLCSQELWAKWGHSGGRNQSRE
jgi:hypothetical protein